MTKTNLYPSFVFAVAFFLWSCGSDDNIVPNAHVDIKINTNYPDYSALQNPGGWVYVTGGVNGIFVYNFDNQTYFAYDRACTCNPNDAPLVYDEHTHELCHADTVKNCNSRYSVMMHGAVSGGDAKYALRRYDVVSMGGMLRITSYY